MNHLNSFIKYCSGGLETLASNDNQSEEIEFYHFYLRIEVENELPIPCN